MSRKTKTLVKVDDLFDPTYFTCEATRYETAKWYWMHAKPAIAHQNMRDRIKLFMELESKWSGDWGTL